MSAYRKTSSITAPLQSPLNILILKPLNETQNPSPALVRYFLSPTAGLAGMNMILHDFPTANVLSGNTLFALRSQVQGRRTAHLLEPMHNDRFLRLLDRHYPTWREARAELNELPLAAEVWRE